MTSPSNLSSRRHFVSSVMFSTLLAAFSAPMILPASALAETRAGTAIAHDGEPIPFEVDGQGPALMIMAYGSATEQIINDLSDRYTIVSFHYLGKPKVDTLTPDAVSKDLLAVADAAGVERFAWAGFSWTAVIGQQLAIRTDRMTALIMGGFPPIDGPYPEMLKLSKTISESGGTLYGMDMALSDATADQFAQFVTYYLPLQSFDDRAAQAKITIPRLTYIGDSDRPNLNGTDLTDMGGTVMKNRGELERLGWEVRIDPGKNHLDYTPTETSRIIGKFLDRVLLGQ